MFYQKLGNNKVRCSLCAHYCVIDEGRRGKCEVRENRDGLLVSLVYGRIIAFNVDPIEKKPLFHFYPGSSSYSIATAGCNFMCMHCQNFDIAQLPKGQNELPGKSVMAEYIVSEAEKSGCKSISYTYTEPTIFYEFAYDCAVLAAERGIKNIFVSNGYMTPEAAKKIAPYMDGINIDLKGDDDFYKKICGARLKPVLNTIELMKNLNVWVEVTTLIIPSYNDSDEILKQIAEYIRAVDPAIPWHVSQFYPTYRLTDQPRTPLRTLNRARQIGIETGLKYVYEGNAPGEGGENTYCPNCGEYVIERSGFSVVRNKLNGAGCNKCGTVIDGVFQSA